MHFAFPDSVCSFRLACSKRRTPQSWTTPPILPRFCFLLLLAREKSIQPPVFARQNVRLGIPSPSLVDKYLARNRTEQGVTLAWRLTVSLLVCVYYEDSSAARCAASFMTVKWSSVTIAYSSNERRIGAALEKGNSLNAEHPWHFHILLSNYHVSIWP